MFQKIVQFFFFMLVVFLLPTSSFADNPTVISFTASPSAMNSDYTTILSWTIQGASAGHDLYFFCPAGVKIKKMDGTIFPCNVRTVASSNVSDSVGFNIINVSGGIATVLVRIYPRDSTGVDYDAGARDVYITVNTSPQPVTNFTTSTTTVAAGEIAILSWIAYDLEGVNLQFDCVTGVQVFASGNSTPLACNTPAFTSILPVSGSSSFTFTNSSLFAASLTIRVLPVITTGLYDATHALSLSLNISGKPTLPDVLINSFTVSKMQVSSGDSLVFSWSAPQASGVNFQIACNNLVSVMNSQGTTTSSKLPCNTLVFSQSLPVASSTTLSFLNNSNSSQSLSIYLLPQNADGTYDGTKSKKIDIIVSLPGQNIAAPVVSSSSVKIVRTVVFTQYLYKGSRGSQVEALQKFLAQDKTLYPEGLITGYLGNLSESAVKRFQDRYNIAHQGDGGYGFVGPKTRAKLNSLDYF